MIDETREKDTPIENQSAEEAPDAPKEEKTSEEIKSLQKQIDSLQAQKEHFREKAQQSSEELEELRENPPPPSEIDRAEALSSWDQMSPTEQNLFKRQRDFKREIDGLKDRLARTTTKLDWDDQFSQLTKNPTFSSIAKRREKFKEFCGESMPSEVMAKAFLFEDAKEIGAKEEKDKTRPGLETSSGGERKAPSPELTSEQREYLRVKEPEKYKALIRKGVIG